MSRVPEFDYNKAAHQLWSRIGTGSYNKLDSIYTSPQGGNIYVGRECAAQDLDLLLGLNVTSVVNCTMAIPNFHSHKLKYMNFNISNWWAETDDNIETAISFVSPMLKFVEEVIKRGESVLVHCLAGAHRAGTAGIICLMHFQCLPAIKAKEQAKLHRPIIDPIGNFPKLLKLCDSLPRSAEGRFRIH